MRAEDLKTLSFISLGGPHKHATTGVLQVASQPLNVRIRLSWRRELSFDLMKRPRQLQTWKWPVQQCECISGALRKGIWRSTDEARVRLPCWERSWRQGSPTLLLSIASLLGHRASERDIFRAFSHVPRIGNLGQRLLVAPLLSLSPDQIVIRPFVDPLPLL